MESKLVDALCLGSSPVAVILTDHKPEGALQFKEGKWGCVASTLLAVAKGHTAVFDRGTFGCPGGGTGLGFGNQYEQCSFAIDALLSTGDTEAAARNQRSSKMGEGERFFKSPEVVRHWVEGLPIMEVPTEFVVMKPFSQLTAEDEPAMLVFIVNADQLSALVVLSDYARGAGESVIVRFGGACQSILFGFAESKVDAPRGIIGFFDIALRSHVDRETLSFTVPWELFREMEANVDGSFLQMEDWLELRKRQ